MTFNEIRIAIETLLVNWNQYPLAIDGLPVPPSVKQAQTDGATWVRLTINPGATIPAGKGSTPEVRRTGLISIQVFAAAGQGSKAAYDACDALTPLLQHKITGGLETLALTVSRTGEQDNYYQLNASVPYRAKH